MRASEARFWGWHRLDRAWAARIVAAADVTDGELVLDIGAGEGVLSEALVRAGARVIAFELHPGRVQLLRRRFDRDSVRVVHADAADLRLPRRPFRVVANPPFAVSTAILRRLVAPGSRLVAADLVLPRHTARRWCEGAVRGTLSWSDRFEASLGLRVPAGSFRPGLARDAVVLRLRRRTAPERGARVERPAGRRGPPSR